MHHIGPYTIVRQLAVGGQARVLLGRLGGPGGFAVEHALKVLKSPLGGTAPTKHPEARAMIAEARLLARLNSPHQIAVHGLAVYDDHLVMVQEHVHGMSLARLLKALPAAAEGRGTLPTEHALWIARSVALALHEAHTLQDERGRPLRLVHRDVNPANILIGYDGRVALIDFGIAISRMTSRQTRVGRVRGKPEYLSPEQAMESDHIDHRVDIYALGLTLYEMVTGVRPLEGDPATVIDRARHPSIPTARSHNPSLHLPIDPVFDKALARDPDQRFPTARELGIACARLLAQHHPTYCGDEPGAFLRALAPPEEPKRRAGTQVIAAPPPINTQVIDVQDIEYISPPSPPADETTRVFRRHRHADALRTAHTQADEPPPFREADTVVERVEEVLDLGALLKEIEDIYDRRSGRATRPAEDGDGSS